MSSKEIITFVTNDKFAEAKEVLRGMVTKNTTDRISAKQAELGLTPVKKDGE